MLADLYPESLHVTQIGLGGGTDEAVWIAAAAHGCVLLTRDEDFHRLSVLRGAPPKVVWLRLGNASTEEVARLLRERRGDVGRFEGQDEVTLLELGW
jgi:predicted nuclease of predicted toxin-antitoxin system